MATNIEQFYRLTPLQEGMLFQKLYHSESSEYVIQTCMKIEGNLDLIAAQNSINLLAVKHDVIRTSFFYQKATKPKQVVLRERKLEFTEVDLSGCKDEEKLAEQIAIIKREDIDRGFNLERDSLLRVKVIKTGEREFRMLWSFHHIIMDGWCLSLIYGDFIGFYKILLSGKDYETLKEEVIRIRNMSPRYGDYIKWLDRQDEDEAMRYWKEILRDYETEAVIKPVEEAIQTEVQSAELEHILDAKKTTMVKELSAQLGVTLSHIVEGAWGLLLQRYSNSRDVVFGKVVSGRNANIPGIEQMVGLFINTVPERIKQEEGMSVADFLKKVRTQAVESERYEYAPLVEIQADSRMGNKLINTLYVFENYFAGENDADQGEQELFIQIEDAREQTNYDLSLSASIGQGLSLKMMYNPQVFTKHETKLLLEKLQFILEQFAGNPDMLLDDISAITEEEKQKILETFNETSYAISKELTMSEMFEEQVEIVGDKIAVVDGEKKISYTQLNSIANQIANRLVKEKIGSGDYVAILMNRSVEMIAALLGVLKSGAAYVPIDPEYPEERIQYMLEDCKATAILSIGKHTLQKENTLCIDLTDLSLTDECSENLTKKPKTTDLAYLIYTSGTTGRPKGVMVEHGGVVDLREYFWKEQGITEEDRTIQFASMAFDAMVSELCMSIFSGGTLYIVPDEARMDTTCFADFIAEAGITAMVLPPQFVSNVQFKKPVRTIITAGSESNPELVEKLSKICHYSNDYGPTECTVCATHWGYLADGKERKQVPIGKPILNKHVYILYQNTLCGYGMPGELCISGKGIARGYLNQEELTQKKFVENPFGEGKLYRTGDLAMWLPDGNILFLGRIDEQVKIRGFRIELQEIENVIRGQQEVKSVAVVAIADAKGEKQIAAYVVGHKEGLDLEKLKGKIRRKLPDYMMPTYMMEIAEIPVTINGKLDKHALPEVNQISDQEYVAPRDEVEKIIAEIFASILERETVSIKDNFFHIGGHSLRAARVVNQIEAELSIKILLKELFANPTIEELSDYIKSRETSGENEIPQAPVLPRYRMSSMQRRLFMINQMEPNQIIYNMPSSIELEGDFSKEKVQKVFADLVERHEALRTSFVMEEGEFYQCIQEHVETEIEYEDFADVEVWNKEEEYKKFIRPFVLDKAPLMRMKLIHMGNQKFLFFMDMHHIIGDGMTMNILKEEFGALYNGATLEPLRVQYKDYSEWEAKRDLTNQKEYWINQFSDEVPVLDMKTDFPRPKIQSYCGHVVSKSTGKKLRQDAVDFCKTHKVTEYMFLISALMILLGKYSRQEDIIIGAPVSGRVHRDTEHMAGVFVNTLALRGKPERSKTAAQFLEEIKNCCLSGFENQEFAFDELVEAIEINQDISRNPLFDIMFVLQNNEQVNVDLSDVRGVGKVESEYTISKFDLTVNANSSENGYNFMFEYNTDLYKEETIEHMAQHYIELLQHIIENDLVQLGDLEAIDEFEKVLVTEQFNSNEREYPRDKTVSEIFAEQVKRFGNKNAIIFEDRTLTYGELDKQSSKIAYTLRSVGVERNDYVAIEAERSIETIICICGIIKAGAAYVPLDYSYPKDRLQYIVDDCTPKIVLATKSSFEFLQNTTVVSYEEAVNVPEDVKIELVNQPEDLAYLIYTSGSTGKSKGVMVEHRNIVNLVINQNYIGLSENNIILQTGSLAFDASTFEIWGVLLNGGTLCLTTKEIMTSAKLLKELIKQKKITDIFVTVALYDQLFEEMPEVFHDIDSLMIGGEQVSENNIKIMQEKNPNVEFYNIYGPTETTTFAVRYRVYPDVINVKTPIGKPLANVKTYILDGNSVCGIGMPGELCIAGDGVARGYLNNQEMTNDKFVDGIKAGERMYRTGDLACWLPDGNIEFLGRVDEQVKIRGFRIEPGEIKNAILEHIHVQDAAVIVRTDSKGEKILCAYFVNNEILDVEEAKVELRKILPEYMIPNIMIQIDKIPITVNGKVDKKKLPKVEFNRVETYVAPQTKTEQMVVDIYQEVLGMDKVGIYDNFFELGGHSLRATKAVNRIEECCGVRISLKTMFLCPTPKLLAKEIDASGDGSYEMIPKAEEKEYYPMSSAQKRLYVINSLGNMGIVYNMPAATVMHGKLDMQKMNQALQQLVERHELLRTSFCDYNGELVQKIEKEVEVSVEYKELPNSGEKEKQRAFTEFVRPFSMERAPLLRVRVVKCSEDEHLIFFDMHHIISDGMSMTIIQKEFTALYNGVQLPALYTQYKDYSEWIRRKDLSSQKEYWLKQFEDEIPVLNMPLDYQRPQMQSFRGAVVKEFLPEGLCNQIEEIARNYGATEYMFYVAAYMMLLSRYSRQEDIIIGTPVSGRTHRDMESMLGMFVNTLVLRGKPERDKIFCDFLVEMKEFCLKAYENQECPFEEVVENLNLTRDLSRNPLFDIMFAFQNNEVAEGAFDEMIATDSLTLNEITAKFDITVNIERVPGGYSFVFEYCADLFKPETIQYMASHYKCLLEEIVKNPERKLKEYNCLTKEEEKLVIETFNDNETDYCSDQTISDIFKTYAEARLDDVAVEYGDQKLTYAQLDNMSDKVAYSLIHLGVMADDAVAVVAEHSVETIAGILGVIKVGAAYVPIDESYPKERICYMLEDCKAKALLTNRMEENLENQIPVLKMSQLEASLSEEKENLVQNAMNLVNSDNLAYIIYTSGTSGKPKGSLIEQKSVLRLVKNTNFIHFDENTCVLQTGAISFDASTFEIWGPLLNGGKVVLADKDIILDPIRFGQEIVNRKVNVMWLTAALFNQMVDCDVSMFDTLEYLLIGGEKLSESHVRLLKEHNRHTKLINGYGPTENTTFTTTYLIPEKFDYIPIGEPIANTKVYVLDEDTLCGIGMPGELCTSGAGLSRGYLNMDKLTAEKFKENPFGDGKMYYTGDLVRWHEGGTVEYLGRIDEQVKIRGFRIELGEVENAIIKTGMVKEAAVVVKENQNQDKYIAAYYVACTQKGTPAELREKLEEMLPEYMVPAYLVPIEKMPVTRNGKLDKKALPEVVWEYEKEYVKPETTEEKVLVEVFQETLGFTDVGITDSFFELGGDSIKAIRVVSKLREYGYNLEVKDIIRERVLKNIATKMILVTVEQMCEQSEVTGETGLSPIQKTFFGWNYPYPNHFNQALIFRLEEDVTEEQIKEVLGHLVKHHDALRTVFRDGKQLVLSTEESPMFDFYSYDVSEKSDYASYVQQKNTEIQASMDIENGPLVKAVFYKYREEKHLMLTIHHLVVDGVSWRILMEDFTSLLGQIMSEMPVVLPSKTMSYKSWTEKIEAQKNNQEILTQKRYWNKINEQVMKYMLPTNKIEKSVRIKSTGITLDYEDTKKLLYQANDAFQTGINDLLLAAVGNAVKSWSGLEAIAVAQESHGRQKFANNIMVERTVGWFTNMYPIIVQSGNDIKETIINTKEMLRSVPDEGIGYAILKSYVEDCEYTAEPELCFNYLGDFDNESNRYDMFGGSTLSEGDEFASENKTSYSISMSGSIATGQLKLGIMYDECRYSKEEIDRFCNIYVEELKKIIEFCVSQDGITYTASDFGTPGIAQDEIQKIVDRYHEKEMVQKVYPLTPLQEGMLYYKLLDEDSTEYVIQEVFRIKSAIDTDAMSMSLKLLAEKYDSLRTAIFYSGINRPKQVVLKDRSLEFIYQDLVELNEEAKKETLEALKQEDVARGFQLEEDSLLRVTAIRIKENDIVILWTAHHIIMDGWCTSLLFKDFLRSYDALTVGGLSYQQISDMVLEETKEVAPYSDYIAWLERQDKEEGLHYWKNLLEGYESVASIPSCTCIPKDKKGHVNLIEIVLEEDESKALHQMAIDNNITLNTVLECAWGIVLQRYNQVEDVVFGKVVSGRNANIKGIEKAVGLFINTIPMRVMLQENSTIRELLQQIQEQSMESQNYDYCALSEVQECSSLGHQLFDTLFVYENYYMEDMSEQGESVDGGISLENAREETNYPITVSVSYETTLHINIMYNTSQYGIKEIERILKHIRQVLKSFVQHPDMSVEKIDFLTEEEKKEVLVDFQRTRQNGWEDKIVSEIWEDTVQKNAERIAVKYLDQEMTFQELNDRVNQMAHTLRSMGVQPDDFVAIMTERSIEMIVAILSVVKSGGAYVPIDPTYPEDRILYMLNDCKPKAILTYRATVPEEGAYTIIDMENENFYAENWNNPVHVNSKDDLLYMIYTSGTTGRPKGVMIQHASLLNMVKHYEREYSITTDDTILQFASVSFDQSVWDIFGSLLLGAAVCCMPYSYIGMPRVLESYMNEKNVTMAALTPAYLRELDYKNLPKLTRIESGGAAAEPEVLNRWKQVAAVYNTYGPTEATVNAITYRLDDEQYTNIPIGKPVENLRVYILDKDRLCGIGMSGEICIAGKGLARGYLNQAELTAEKFVPDILSEGKMYRTGDLGRWLEGGLVEYLGRVDEQVKIRGFRIELGEIETVLKNQESVDDAVIAVKKDKQGDSYLIAYVVNEKESIDVHTLRTYLQKLLPNYMVPAYFMQIDSIPLTQNGKVNKRALPEVTFGSKEEYVAPETECEKLLVSIFEEVMGIEQISVNDCFMNIGGNSIKAIGIASKIRNAGYEFGLKEILKNQTIREMAANMKMIEENNAIVLSLNYMYDETVSMSEEQFIETEICREIKKFDENKANLAIENSYKPFDYQLNFLENEQDNICPLKISVEGEMTKEALLTGIRQIIKEQSVLRTTYDKAAKKLLEYAFYDDWVIPYIELQDEKQLLNDFEHVHHYPKLFETGSFLAKVFVVKVSDINHVLYVYAQHAIWDEMSGEVMLQLLQSRLKNEPDGGRFYFSSYVQSRNDEKTVDVKEAKENTRKYLDVVKKYAKGNMKQNQNLLNVEMELDDDVIAEIKQKPIEWMLQTYSQLQQKEVNSAIPFIMMHHGREGKQFEQLGLYLRIVPGIVVDGSCENYNEHEFHMNFHNINILNKYKNVIPFVNYYSVSQNAQMPQLKQDKAEMEKLEKDMGCVIKMGFIGKRLSLQIPVGNQEIEKYMQILRHILKKD